MNNTIAIWAINLIFISASVSAEENFDVQTCQQQGFVNTYHLIDVNDINAVSLFFKEIGDSYFIELSFVSSIVGIRNRVSTYYDFENLEILESGKEMVHVVDENLPNFRTERERIKYIDNELETRKSISYEVKKYGKKIATMDKHPLFSRIKRSERNNLINILSTISKMPLQNLSAKLKVNSNDVVYLIKYYAHPIGAITLSGFNVSSYGIAKPYSLLRFEIFEDNNKYLTKLENQQVNEVICNIYNDFQHQFPNLDMSFRFGYAEFHDLAKKDSPNLMSFKKFPMLFDVGQILILSLFGFLLIKLILGRYIRKNNYRKTTFMRQLK